MELKQNSFGTVLFQFHFVVRTVLRAKKRRWKAYNASPSPRRNHVKSESQEAFFRGLCETLKTNTADTEFNVKLAYALL